MGYIQRSAVKRSPADAITPVPKVIMHGTRLSSQHGIMIGTQRKKAM